MSEWGWVILGWSVVVASLAVYTVTVFRRGARLTPQVAPDRRRWISAPREDVPA